MCLEQICTVHTNLRITATPNEGYFISSIDGIENEGVINGNSKIYDVNLKENANSIIINFTENPKEEIKDEIVQSDVIQEEIQDTSNEIDTNEKKPQRRE